MNEPLITLQFIENTAVGEEVYGPDYERQSAAVPERRANYLIATGRAIRAPVTEEGDSPTDSKEDESVPANAAEALAALVPARSPRAPGRTSIRNR